MSVAGTSGADFLKLPVSARSMGLGEAFSTLKNDIDTVSYNPAALISLNKSQVSLMHLIWLNEIQFEHLSFGTAQGNNAFGLSILYLHVSSFEQTGASGETIGEISIHDLALSFSYARKIRQVETGMSIRYIERTLGPNSARSISVDFGIIKRFSLSRFKELENFALGFSVRNIGPPIQFLTKKDPLPLTFALGAGYNPLVNLTLTLELTKSGTSGDFGFHSGAEYRMSRGFFLRLGGSTPKSEQGFTGGAGIRQGVGNLALELDYAFRAFSRQGLGTSHALSMKIIFGT